jgi:hypothetical protein
MIINIKQYPNNVKECSVCQIILKIENFYLYTQSNKKDRVWKYRSSACIKCMTNKRKSRKQEAINYLGSKCLDCVLIVIEKDILNNHALMSETKSYSTDIFPLTAGRYAKLPELLLYRTLMLRYGGGSCY